MEEIMKSLRFLFHIGVIIIFLAISTGMRPLNPLTPSSVTITVTTTADEWTNPGPETGCALREALRAAGTHASFGGCTYSGSGAVTIILPAGNYVLTGNNLVVESNITINGGGQNTTIIDGNNHTQIFWLNGASNSLTLNDLTVTHGIALARSDGADGSNGGNDQNGMDGESVFASWGGGAIMTDDTPVVVNRVKFLDNAGGDGGNGGKGGNGGTRITSGLPTNGGNGGYGGDGGRGGAIYTASAPVTITDCIFDGNHSGVGGSGGNGGNAGTPVAFSVAYPGSGGNGGIGNYGGAGGGGGAIYSETGTLTITGSTFFDNYTSPGGRSGVGGNGATGLNGTVLTNYIAGAGGAGGISEWAGHGGYGGAIYSGATLVITNSKFYNNTTGTGGAGGSGGLAGNGGIGANNPGASSPGCCKGGAGGDGGRGGNGRHGGRGGAVYSVGSLTITGSSFYENSTGAGGNGNAGMPGGSGGAGGSSPDNAPGGNGGIGGRGGASEGHGNGGAIAAFGGPITISNSVIHDNSIDPGGHAGNGGAGGTGGSGGQGLSGTQGGTGGIGGAGGDAGYYLLSGYGGGIYTEMGSSKSLNITNVTISGNTSAETTSGNNGGAGGAGGNGGSGSIPSIGGPGGAGGNGGDANRGTPGGGIALYNQSGSTTNLVFVTVAFNTTPAGTGTGGALGSGGQGGIGSEGAQAANGSDGSNGGSSAPSSGGGLYRTDGTVNLKNSLVAANITDASPDCIGNFVSQDYNLVGVTGDCGIVYAGHDLHDGSASPLNIGPLASNYGKTKTHAILAGSAALNYIPSGTNGCGTTYKTDQRGFYRPLNSACEIGAFEYGHLMRFLPLILKLAGVIV